MVWHRKNLPKSLPKSVPTIQNGCCPNWSVWPRDECLCYLQLHINPVNKFMREKRNHMRASHSFSLSLTHTHTHTSALALSILISISLTHSLTRTLSHLSPTSTVYTLMQTFGSNVHLFFFQSFHAAQKYWMSFKSLTFIKCSAIKSCSKLNDGILWADFKFRTSVGLWLNLAELLSGPDAWGQNVAKYNTGKVICRGASLAIWIS